LTTIALTGTKRFSVT